MRGLFTFILSLTALYSMASCRFDCSRCEVKPSANDRIEWEHLRSNVTVTSISQVSDTNYVLAGGEERNGEMFPMMLKVENNVVGPTHSIDEPSSYFVGFHALGDGTFLAASRRFLYRLDENFGVVWAVQLTGINDVLVGSIWVSGAGVAVASLNDNSGVYLTKYDIEGIATWQKPLVEAYNVLLFDNGELALVAVTDECIGLHVEQLDKDGATVWTREHKIKGCRCCVFSRGAILSDGAISIVVDESYEGIGQVVAKIGAEGDLVWERTVPMRHYVRAIAEMEDGSLLLVGRTCESGERSSDAWVYRLDPLGRPLLNLWFGGKEYEYAAAIHADASGRVFVAAQRQVDPRIETGWLGWFFAFHLI